MGSIPTWEAEYNCIMRERSKEERLDDIEKIVNDNNKILRGIRRKSSISNTFKFLIVVFVLFFGFYLYNRFFQKINIDILIEDIRDVIVDVVRSEVSEQVEKTLLQ